MAILDVKKVISEVVAANARLPLAAERLTKIVGERVTEADILRALVDDQTTLTEQLRAQLMLQLFNTLMETQIAFRASIADLGPDAVSRSYTAQMTAFAQLSAKPLEESTEQPVSIMDARQNLLDRVERLAERGKKRSSAEQDESNELSG